MFSKLVTSALALSLAATMAMAADGVRFNVIKDSMLKDAPKGEKAVSEAEKKYNQWFSDQLQNGVEWKDVTNRNARFEEILFEEHRVLAKRYGLEYKRSLTNASK